MCLYIIMHIWIVFAILFRISTFPYRLHTTVVFSLYIQYKTRESMGAPNFLSASRVLQYLDFFKDCMLWSKNKIVWGYHSQSIFSVQTLIWAHTFFTPFSHLTSSGALSTKKIDGLKFRMQAITIVIKYNIETSRGTTWPNLFQKIP